MNDRAVSARRLAENAAVVARRERAALAIDEWNELVHQMIGVTAHRRCVDVLIAVHAREAIGKDHDARPHPPLVRAMRDALRDVLVERPSSEMRERSARLADEMYTR